MLKKLFVVGMCLASLIGLTACSKNMVKPYPEEAFKAMKEEDATRTDNSELRIMSYNVLVHIKSWGGTPVKPRAQMLSEVLNHYSPDVVGLQEFCSDWYQYLLPQIETTYAILQPKFNALHENRSPIIYNKTKLTLIESGLHKYTGATKNYCRVVTWGVFKNNATKQNFAVTSTHWDFGTEEKKIVMRNTQVAELNNIIDTIETQYSCPVFAVGDYNSYEQSIKDGATEYIKFVKESGCINTKFIEGITQNFREGTDYFAESWDHIFLRGKADIKSFNILSGKFYEDLSDHNPIYVDVNI